MKPFYKKLIFALIVLAALVVWISDKYQQEWSKNEDKKSIVGKVLLEKSLAATIDSIEIQSAKEIISIKNPEGNGWFLESDGGFPAQGLKILRLFEDLGQAKVIRVVTSLQKEIDELNLTAATIVQLSQKGKLIEKWHFGTRREMGGQYIGNSDLSQVWLINKNIDISTSIADWENKTLLDVSDKLIKQVELRPKSSLKKGDLTIFREKEDAEFLVTQGEIPEEELNKDTINLVKGTLQNLAYTNRFDSENEGAKLAFNSTSHAIYTLFDGRRYVLEIGSMDKGGSQRYFIKILEEAEKKDNDSNINMIMSKWAFEISDYLGQRLVKGRSDFIKGKS
ncbi:MAG: DUF4340 domain-containing protein [Oligoflexales bacterium]|nr:DUF4340 domain-containing protein [Oligoflexales bacterium]